VTSFQYRSQSLSDLPDVRPEIDHHRKKGPQVEHDIEEDLRLFHPKYGLEKDEMPGTADGQEFGQSLNDSEEDSLWDVDFNTPLRMSSAKVQML